MTDISIHFEKKILWWYLGVSACSLFPGHVKAHGICCMGRSEITLFDLVNYIIVWPAFKWHSFPAPQLCCCARQEEENFSVRLYEELWEEGEPLIKKRRGGQGTVPRMNVNYGIKISWSCYSHTQTYLLWFVYIRRAGNRFSPLGLCPAVVMRIWKKKGKTRNVSFRKRNNILKMLKYAIIGVLYSLFKV